MDEKLRSAIGTIHQDFPVDKVYVFGSFDRRHTQPWTIEHVASTEGVAV
jgi:predicted nucleotidyltransferase